jgi:Alpha/beta hydrolase domain
VAEVARDPFNVVGAIRLWSFELAERLALGDSRPSLEERYPTRAEYVSKVAAAANSLARDRLLLGEDVAAYVKKAEAAPLDK